jgi:hypothetical protein
MADLRDVHYHPLIGFNILTIWAVFDSRWIWLSISHHIRRCRMLEMRSCRFWENNNTVSWRRGFAIRVYSFQSVRTAIGICTLVWWVRITNNTQQSITTGCQDKWRWVDMQIVLDVLYFMNCLPTNIQTNESLYPIQTCVWGQRIIIYRMILLFQRL